MNTTIEKRWGNRVCPECGMLNKYHREESEGVDDAFPTLKCPTEEEADDMAREDEGERQMEDAKIEEMMG